MFCFQNFGKNLPLNFGVFKEVDQRGWGLAGASFLPKCTRKTSKKKTFAKEKLIQQFSGSLISSEIRPRKKRKKKTVKKTNKNKKQQQQKKPEVICFFFAAQVEPIGPHTEGKGKSAPLVSL